MAARDDDFRAADPVIDRNDIGAEPVADVVIFDHDALALRHNRFEFTEIENHIGAIEAAYRPADDFAGAILELLINHFLFDLANPLHHRLFRGLGGDAAEIARRHFHFDGVANLRVRLDLARFAERDFVLWILDIFNYQKIGQRTDVARSRIDVDPQIAGRADAFLRSRKERVRDCLKQDLALDAAFPLQIIKHGNKFGVHKNI